MNFETISAVARDEILVAELYRLDIRHLARLTVGLELAPVSPVDLISALATHSDARFQATLILLFLRHPDFRQYLTQSLEQLDTADALTLKLYYQAAVYLQRELATSLASQPQCREVLSDYFSAELGLPSASLIRPSPLSAQPALEALGKLHQRHSGWQFNWAGSYRQQIPLFLKHLGTRHA